MLQKIIYKLGVKWRNPSLLRQFESLKKSDKWSIEKLQAYQFERLKTLLQFAYDHSPFYKKEFDEVGFHPSQMTSPDDMKVLPVIDKSVLIRNNGDIQSTYKFDKLQFSETSGSSGKPLLFYRDEEWDSGHRAAVMRGQSWYGIMPWDRNGYLWGYNIDRKKTLKTKILDRLCNRFRMFSYAPDDMERFCRKLRKSAFLSGYASMIYETARYINTHPHDKTKYHLKLIKGTSEKIYPNYHEETQKAFGLKITSEYGAAEAGIIAFECPEGKNMHICMENVYVEVIDGEIVVTNLLSRSFPIIRYKLGDAVVLASPDYKCPCGRNHPVVLDVCGRIGKNILGKTSKYPSLTFYYVFKNIAIQDGITLNYQARQDEKGKIIESYATKDSRIKLFRLASNSGAGIARNKSIEEARGRYIAFCDSDDLWKPQKLEKQVEFMQKNGYEFVYCKSDVIDTEGNVIAINNRVRRVSYFSTIIVNFIGTSSAIYDTRRIGKIYMKDVRKRQDWLLWIDILRLTRHAYCTPERMSSWRTGNENSLSARKSSLFKYHLMIYKNYLGFSAPIAFLICYGISLPCFFVKKIRYRLINFFHRRELCK